MELSAQQVAELAPDSSALAAATKLMAPRNWAEIGRSPEAWWGVCRGSKLYQVKVDRSDLGYNCNCPSRKFPCKHVLGLMMFWSAFPDAPCDATAPDWVTEWLVRRREKAQKKGEREPTPAAAPSRSVDKQAQRRRAAKRESRVSNGLAGLDVWLRDLVRNGLAGLETRPMSFWTEQAKRLVDAQAPGVASRVTRLANLPRSSPDWPQRLLAELGRLQLLIRAWERIEQLDTALQSDVRQWIGWTVRQDELQRDGEQVEDSWIVLGQWVDDEERVRAERSWVLGRRTRRLALVLQFAPGRQPFPDSIFPATEQRGTLVFYPGAARQRAKFIGREGKLTAITRRPPGTATIDDFLAAVGRQVASHPWLPAFGAMLHDVTLITQDDRWLIRDRNAQSVPLWGRDHWTMLAITGGHPFDLAGEWDGYCLRPLGIFADGTYRGT